MNKTQIGHDVGDTYGSCRVVVGRINSAAAITGGPPADKTIRGRFWEATAITQMIEKGR